mmetsp:Transcript_88783/g.153768  ORF Transcript_88783/g.153768 Transcript_88783/m.153768 type:complete len:503 (+) Transcript_88783:88-1596(+)
MADFWDHLECGDDDDYFKVTPTNLTSFNSISGCSSFSTCSDSSTVCCSGSEASESRPSSAPSSMPPSPIFEPLQKQADTAHSSSGGRFRSDSDDSYCSPSDGSDRYRVRSDSDYSDRSDNSDSDAANMAAIADISKALSGLSQMAACKPASAHGFFDDFTGLDEAIVAWKPAEAQEAAGIDKESKAQLDSFKTSPKCWMVCEGHDEGGIAVRSEEDLSSSVIGRLQANVVVEEQQRNGDSIRYTRVYGDGPLTGWVSTRSDGKAQLQTVASDWTPFSTPPSSPPSPNLEPLPKQANLIFFDWDDTLCPTSWIEERPELKHSMDVPRTGQPWSLLSQQAQAVGELVRTARSLGPVALVTLAQRPWVKNSIRDFMPLVGGEVLHLDVFYARESPGRAMVPGACAYTAMKRRAMLEALTELAKKGDTTWESLISIGDSDVEKRAAQDLGRELQSRGKIKWTKTVKMTEHPSVMQLTSQVRALNERFSELVNHRGHKHVDAEWLNH